MRVALRSIHGSFVNVPRANDTSLGLVAGRATCTSELAGSKTFLPHTSSRDAHADASSNRAWSTSVPPTRPVPNSPSARDPSDHPGCGT